MEKPVIREHMIQTLKQMPIKQKQQKETLILQLLFSSQIWQTKQTNRSAESTTEKIAVLSCGADNTL